MKYSTLQKVLHALSALTIIWLLMSGFYAGLISEDAALKRLIGELNVSVSLSLAPFFCYVCASLSDEDTVPW